VKLAVIYLGNCDLVWKYSHFFLFGKKLFDFQQKKAPGLEKGFSFTYNYIELYQSYKMKKMPSSQSEVILPFSEIIKVTACISAN